jgi:tetratricopeptide (TPR) repeat protein
MKKFVFAYAIALVSICLLTAPMLRAQDITIKDPAEFNAYQFAASQTDAKTKASQLENFLQSYPQSVVKNSVLDQLMDTYQGIGDNDKALGAATRLLQVDPNNMKAVFISVYIKKNQCGKTQDAQTCDDAASLARKGLLLPKPAATSDADWKKLTGATFPAFHSAIALDDAVSKKDYKAAIDEYKAELMLYTDDQSKSIGLPDTLQLAQAYVQPGAAKDLVQAIWFYSRVWDFAPPAYKAKIEPELERWYKKYHGALDGLDAIKTQAAASTFPPGTLTIALAKTPAEQIHDLLATTPDPAKMALADKETVLAVGSKEDADKMWALLKDQITPIPGIVIDTAIGSIKVIVTQGAGKPTDFVVNLKAPISSADKGKTLPAEGADLSAQKAFILASVIAADTDRLTALFSDDAKPVTKIVIEAPVSVIKMAVTQDAKDAKTADFIVNLKEPLADKEVPAAGFTYGIQPAAELNGTYDTYTQIPATATTTQAALIVLRDGFIQPETKKKPVPAAHKPAAGHRAAAK